MDGIKFVNFGAKANVWRLDTVSEICQKVKEYADRSGLKDVVLSEVEDCTWSDPVNQRYNIDILYKTEDGRLISQRLLMLKGEVLDGPEFHKRVDEFYPKSA